MQEQGQMNAQRRYLSWPILTVNFLFHGEHKWLLHLTLPVLCLFVLTTEMYTGSVGWLAGAQVTCNRLSISNEFVKRELKTPLFDWKIFSILISPDTKWKGVPSTSLSPQHESFLASGLWVHRAGSPCRWTPSNVPFGTSSQIKRSLLPRLLGGRLN